MSHPIDAATYRKDLTRPLRAGYDHRPAGRRPSSVVVHATHGRPGSSFAAEAAFLRNSPDVSAHYLIGRDGQIAMILPPAERAWHAGVAQEGWGNSDSIGVELHAAASEPILPAQKQALAELLTALCRDYSIPRDKIASHRAVALPKGRKSDPGQWSDADLAAWLRTTLGGRPSYTEDSPILGPMPDDPPALAARVLSRPTGEYTSVAVREIVQGYLTTAGLVGVDPVLALAQCLHETGNLTSFWAARPRRNPAGLGVNGRRVSPAEYAAHPDAYPPAAWARTDDGGAAAGLSFDGWVTAAIPAHVGRLLAYAVPVEARTGAQAMLIERATAQRRLPAIVHGSAPTLKQLGRVHNTSGLGWADPGDGYGAAIARVANWLIGEAG